MTPQPRPSDDEPRAWDADVARSAGSGQNDTTAGGDEVTYRIPGGLSGWVPGDVPTMPSTGKSLDDTPVRRTARREEPVTPDAPTAVRRQRRPVTNATWELLGLNLIVFVASVCVMTLELTASRLLAKHIGSSLYTWTSVIGVVLAGMTVGNAVGGWMADRFSRARTLAWMFLLASVACASVLWLDQIVAGMSRPESISWPAWVLMIVGAMFFLPAVLLGTTSPLVASLALERSSKTGTTVGHVYAWGAAGSIVGTFLTGFYLVDVWGTRSIIGMTAGTLAILAAVVAGSRGVFRTAVVLGWLQLLCLVWVVATVSRVSAEEAGRRVGTILAAGDDLSASTTDWKEFGRKLGGQLHELGLLLKLRDDQPGAYHDESSYSYIQVRDDVIEGESVRALRLDMLDHSYFNPAEPSKLHYEYEEIYAEVTHRAAPRKPQSLTAKVAPFPGRDDLVRRLPPEASFEPATQLLTVKSAEPVMLESLERLSSSADYWDAVESLQRETSLPNWGGFSTIPLDALPAGVVWPQELELQVRYDTNLMALSAYEPITAQVRDRLLSLTPDAPWHAAIEELRKISAPLKTLFIGGGGFIFPRWILAEYPAAERVDVAELDPAVYDAVRREMGLAGREAERINTLIGDARNVVDDRLRANARAGSTAVHYDFIYGDAFNDFSVPWHLTTLEFTRKLYDLLTPQGVYLANIIEIYPRTLLMGGTVADTMVPLPEEVPSGLYDAPEAGKATQVQSRFHPVEVRGGTMLCAAGRVSSAVEKALVALDPENGVWAAAARKLAARSRQPQPVPEPIPEALRPTSLPSQSWTPCPEPFAGVEIFRDQEGKFLLGLQGAVTDDLHDRLRDLRPDDRGWQTMVDEAVERSQRERRGRFLGRYVHTMTAVFPYVAVFCTSHSHPSDDRDTFVVIGSRRALNLRDKPLMGSWTMTPFAEWTAGADGAPALLGGQMAAVLALAEGQLLTDDFAPVDNLLLPVFVDDHEEE